MLRSASFISAVSAMGLLAGCAGQTMVTNSDYHETYNPQNFLSYHAARDTKLEVVGDTLGADRGAFNTAVARAMYGQHFGRPANFTTQPGASAEKNLYVVMAFNVAHDRNLCGEQNKLASRSQGGVTQVQAAWCWGNQTQAWVLSQGPATRPGDANFDRLIAATTQELFTRNPDIELMEEGDNDSVP